MKKIWLIGAGGMAQDYIKVLDGLKQEFIVIGRSEQSAKECEKSTGCSVVLGGLNTFLSSKPNPCSHAIIAVGVEKLYETTKKLLDYGVKNILVEKPGAIRKIEVEELNKLSQEKKSNVLVAYNRRFFASVLKVKELIENDGGITSFNFEFTEWAHTIAPLKKADGVKEKWFLANSTHVVDLAFFLGGKPDEISTFIKGKLDWHLSGSNFSGAGISEKGALFNYQADWASAGRWSVEVLTKENRYILRPMEKLQIQKRGTIAQVFDETIDYSLDDTYKPGLYLQTKYFLENNFEGMCTINEQCNMMDVYNKIGNYET